mmetsp:Transcript_47005/g.114689  ORF Transcript_47005/g.114689 Transcript_47005/m.114689 type:complete len:364 (-) Transcript_47005:119-1210(-)
MSPSSTTSTTSGSSDSPSFEASTTTLIVGRTKHDVKTELCQTIARISKQAIEARQKFVIALSGGSLPSMLDGLLVAPQQDDGDDNLQLQFDKWWIVLADERVVPLDSPDSNLGSIYKHFLSKDNVNIPPSQIIGIDQSVLEKNKDNNLDAATSLIADEYEKRLLKTTTNVDGGGGSSGKIDLALLGFGPDGHTCSLFPGHPLVVESTGTGDSDTERSSTDSSSSRFRLVAPIMDSPKLPPHRITLTMRALQEDNTRNIIICGTGTSKYPIIKDVFGASGSSSNVAVEQVGEQKNTKKKQDDDDDDDAVPAITYYTNVRMVPLSKTTYPSAMVGRRVTSDGPSTPTTSSSSTLTWLIDQDAFGG